MVIDGNYNAVEGFKITGGALGGIWIHGNGNLIAHNEIYRNGNVPSASTYGQNGVYSNERTRDNRYDANYIHDNGRTGSNLDHGLYLCGTNELVTNNIVVYNASYGLQIAGYTAVRNMKVYNNTFAFNGRSGIVLWLNLDGIEIKNNIFYRNANYAISTWDAPGDGVMIDDNLAYGNGEGTYLLANGGSTVKYTLGKTISANPMFVKSNSDYHLQPRSPALAAGLDLPVVAHDFAGDPRTAPYDLGAYQTAHPAQARS